MIRFLGEGLIFWTGTLAGLFFILTFFGCSCNLKLLKSNYFLIKNHKKLIYLAFILFLIHAILALLSKCFGIYI